jgi:hypothetical protein
MLCINALRKLTGCCFTVSMVVAQPHGHSGRRAAAIRDLLPSPHPKPVDSRHLLGFSDSEWLAPMTIATRTDSP